MSNHASESSLPVLSHADGFAASASDVLLLVGRVLLGWTYLTNLKVPNAGFFSWIGAPVEFLIGLTLILGFATRYAALVCLLFLIVATALAHRYWEYPAAQVMGQYNNFLKNLALFGGTLVLFVTGAGRFSVDRMLSKKD